MACKVSRDGNGTTYHIPEDKTGRTPGGDVLPGSAPIDIWWARRFKDRRDETLLIRQESATDRADVVELTLGQVYDVIHALGLSVMRT